jgi:hypothetical protein
MHCCSFFMTAPPATPSTLRSCADVPGAMPGSTAGRDAAAWPAPPGRHIA